MSTGACNRTASDLIAGLDSAQTEAVLTAPPNERLMTFARFRHRETLEVLAEIAEKAQLQLVGKLKADPDGIAVLPARLASALNLVPILSETNDKEQLHLATSWPPDDETIDWIALFTAKRLCWHLALPDKIQQLIVEHYGIGAGSLEDPEDPEETSVVVADQDVDEEAAVVRFVSQVIGQAVAESATDIHFEPREGELRIRYRVDGLLNQVPVPNNLLRFQDAIISRLKIMAKLNISERRLPQDGRISFKTGAADMDIRISTYPTIYAESVSLRLLNQKRQAHTLDELGMNPEEKRIIAEAVELPHGIILVTGPTGSGKSTSLNAFLRQIDSTEERILTIEDPIEYELPGANQGQVHPEIGLTFAGALRHMLRQDPDVIMIGEIRDHETAEIAIQASLTGHLVFSTLHTNDAPGAITRLIDMGVEPYLVASAVELVVAQRLVRRLCPVCARPKPIRRVNLRESLRALGIDQDNATQFEALMEPVGCDRCRGTGYRGRVGLFEILRLGEALHEFVLRRESTRALAKCARETGMRTLNQSAWEKVKTGTTTLDEVLRVISLTQH